MVDEPGPFEDGGGILARWRAEREHVAYRELLSRPGNGWRTWRCVEVESSHGSTDCQAFVSHGWANKQAGESETGNLQVEFDVGEYPTREQQRQLVAALLLHPPRDGDELLLEEVLRGPCDIGVRVGELAAVLRDLVEVR